MYFFKHSNCRSALKASAPSTGKTDPCGRSNTAGQIVTHWTSLNADFKQQQGVEKLKKQCDENITTVQHWMSKQSLQWLSTLLKIGVSRCLKHETVKVFVQEKNSSLSFATFRNLVFPEKSCKQFGKWFGSCAAILPILLFWWLENTPGVQPNSCCGGRPPTSIHKSQICL